MYNNTHGVPSIARSGNAAFAQFITRAGEYSRTNHKMVTAAIPQRVFLKKNAAGTALEMVTAATDEVFAVLVEPKPAGVLDFYCFNHGVEVHKTLVNWAAMGLTEADADQLSMNSVGIRITSPMFSGAV